jgi:uncharacterized protein (DUF885 family)
MALMIVLFIGDGVTQSDGTAAWLDGSPQVPVSCPVEPDQEALYAEVLAGEAGLYSTREASLGALGLRLFRAARLVVDTGIHAFGWSRAKATEWLLMTVPLPAAFADAEVTRYIAHPAQALSYAVGLHELLRLREEARAALGPRFIPREFHRTALGSGSIPLPTLARILDSWVGAQTGAAVL